MSEDIFNALGLNNDVQPDGGNLDKMAQPDRNIPEYTSVKGDNSAETIIIVVAYATLIIGCIVSLCFGISLLDHRATEGMGYTILILGTISSVISWAFLMVIANISNNIRAIKHELIKQNV